MKSVGEILLGYKDDPEKERKRARILKEARDWEESVIEGEARALPVVRPPHPDLDGADPLLGRFQDALPRLNPVQRQTIQALLDSWGV
ncbi:MAG: hypothetical protein P8R54_04775 [Myxococcota bacterium]|nr:hypothetical protein [Myxococcota bacterium]